MSEYVGKSVASEAPDAGGRDFAFFPSSHRFVEMGPGWRAGSHMDLGRSLRQHRSLATTPALTAMISAMVFLAMRWTSDAPVNSASWIDHLEMGPGVLLFALGGALLGLAAAWLAGLGDHHIYSAYDVERLLGVPPLAELPDFDQVSVGVAEEHLLRLTGAIEQARLSSHLKNCLFTGAGPGAGTSTVAARVQKMLEEMDRQTVLLDASTTPPPQSSLSQRRERGACLQASSAGRFGALLRRLAEESREEQTLVLTDAAPLTETAETEVLARFVDVVIVVIEAGVTTHRQLREIAETLHRLQIGAAGFVLNRIRLEKADSAYRASVRRTEERLRSHSRTISRRPSRHTPQPLPRVTPAGNAAASHTAVAEAYAQAVSRLSPQPMDPPERETRNRFEPLPSPAVNPAQNWEHLAMHSNNPAAQASFAPPVEMPGNDPREHSFVEGLKILHQRAQAQHTASIFRDDPSLDSLYDPPPPPMVAPPVRQHPIERPLAYAAPVKAVAEFLPPPPLRSPASNLPAMPVLRLDPRQPFEEIQILPPRRGQYRRRPANP